MLYIVDTYSYKYTHSFCVILIAFPQQQWLCEPAPVLRYTYIACLVVFMLFFHVSVCGLLKILFLRIAVLALMYIRKLNVMSVFKRPFHQYTDMVKLESRETPALAVPALLPSRRLLVTPMIRNVSVLIKLF